MRRTVVHERCATLAHFDGSCCVSVNLAARKQSIAAIADEQCVVASGGEDTFREERFCKGAHSDCRQHGVADRTVQKCPLPLVVDVNTVALAVVNL